MCLAGCFSTITSKNGAPELTQYRYWQQMFGLGQYTANSIVQIIPKKKFKST